MASTVLPAAPIEPLVRTAPSPRVSQRVDFGTPIKQTPRSLSSSTSDTVSTGSFNTSSRSIPASPSNDRSILKVKTQEASLAAEECVPPFPRPRRRKLVRYSTLEIRSYPLCLGDNPAVRGNLPIALDYSKHHDTRLMGLEDYERQRGPRARHREEFRLCQVARKQRLEADQMEPRKLKQCTKAVREIQNHRAWTHRTRALEPIQEGFERFYKAVGNATWNRRRKKRERELLERYRTPSESNA